MKLKISIDVFSEINRVQHFTFFTEFGAGQILYANGVDGLEGRAIFDRFSQDRRDGYCLVAASAMSGIFQFAIDASYNQNIAVYRHLDRRLFCGNCLNDELFDIF